MDASTSSSPPTSTLRPSRRRLLVSGVAVAAAMATALAGSGLPSAAAPAGSDGPAASQSVDSGPGSERRSGRRDVVANLWEWNWRSVARECTTVLGPKGYGAVQVAPPQDSLWRPGSGAAGDPNHPWWEVYQPVRYQLTSRMGNEAEFRSMVATCRRAGVKVIVDAVINHMTGQGTRSYGGVTYSKYEYQGLYRRSNFHVATDACPTSDETIQDFNNLRQVTKCELVSLSDLRTETAYVRDRLAGYLNKLISYGVSGFRVDAAKHIGQADLEAIERRLRRTLDGERPYIALEVVPGGPGLLAPRAFAGQGDLLGFDFADQVKNAFKSYPTDATGSIATLEVIGEQSGLLPSEKTLVFIQNHDTERTGATLGYKDGAINILAHLFMLAWGYGRPQVYASFAYTENEGSPPADAQGFITDTDCSNGWVCNDRNTGIANMVGWHNHVAGTRVRNWYSNGENLIAFSRGSRGWIAINNHTTARTRTFRTGLAAGTYCDIIHSERTGRACSGPTVRVARDGTARVTVPAKDAVAFDTGDLVRR